MLVALAQDGDKATVRASRHPCPIVDSASSDDPSAIRTRGACKTAEGKVARRRLRQRLTLRLAARLGWRATGLELDPAAVRAAREDGLHVIQGSYRKLEEHRGRWDYIICSHVLEHVHHPLDLLELISSALTPSGIAIISCPNSRSYVRKRFGSSWRGLEAPRHLGIPSLEVLVDTITASGFSVTQIPPVGSTTIKQSREIPQSRRRIRVQAGQSVQQLEEATHPPPAHSHPDLTQLDCRKSPTGTAH